MEFLETSFLRLCLLAFASQHLSTWKTAAQAEKPCVDALEDCSYYFNAGECEKHTGVTRQYCPRTCGYCATPPPTRQPECKDLLSDCATLLESPSQCHPAKDFFTKYCPRTCGYCVCDDILPDCMSFVTNPDQCQSSLFFTKYCRKSCSFCEDQSTLSTITPSRLYTSSAASSTTEYLTAPKSSTISSPAPKSPTTKFPPTPPLSPPSLSTRRPTAPPTNPPTTTRFIPPGPIGCSDLLPECASEVKKNPGSCKDNEEYMKEHCPESCKFCDVDPYCEDKMPKDCMTFLARDKEYCKTNPDFMRENCARSCEFCGCSDLLPICSALVENNKDYCDYNRLFMKTNCPMSCLFCSEASNISDEAPTNGDIEVKPPASEAVNDCVDKQKRCKLFAGFKNYCIYHAQFMSRYCPKACQFCEKEYNFSIRTEWNGVPIKHAPITFQIRAQDSRSVLISVSGPFFNDPGPPPSCAPGSPCDGLWDYEVAEVFFLGKKEKYLEIELSPHGQHLLLLLNGVRKKFMDKLPIEYTATINRENNTWTGTAKIPIDYFPPDVRKINAYAIHGSGANRRYESLYPASPDVSNPDFHRLEFFKPFDLEAMFTVSWSKPLSPLWKNSVRRIMRARARI